jgi:phosphatidylethanolamine-binding protein (PEBP) family uncharacterized protein
MPANPLGVALRNRRASQHTLVWARPDLQAPENIRHGKGTLGRRDWAGPMPPRSHGPSAYVFQLFALDQAPGLPAGFALDEVIAAIAGHVIGRARLDGTYEIR